MRATLKRCLLAVLGSAALGCAGAMAGSFTSDFSNPNQTGFTLGSNFAARPDTTTFIPTIESGRLTLTYAEPGENGSIVLSDLDAGATISAFTATFKMRIGGGTSNPGDGLAFYFGNDVAEGSVFGEEGPESMSAGLAVSFDIFDNGENEAPAIDVKVNGTVVARAARDIFSLLSDNFLNVSIQLKADGTLTVSHHGVAIFTDLVLPEYAPAAGALFALGARTGSEFANHWIDDLSITTTVAGAPAAPTITTPPANAIVNEGSPATFSIAWAGTMPFTFQWLKNDAPIDGATSPTYMIASANGADNNATFKCTVSNGQGSVTSAAATLTVNVDSTKPTLVSTKGSDTFDQVTVVFSEPVAEASAQTAANYTLTGASVTGAVLTSPTTVVLTTSKHAEGATLTLTVNNVEDRAFSPNTIEAGSTIPVTSFVFSPGFTKLDVYDGIEGVAVANLYVDPGYLAGTSDRTMFAAGYDSDTAPLGLDVNNENYGAVMSGYVIPAQTGSFRFFSRSDDGSELYLNPAGSDPAGAVLIAAEDGAALTAFLEPGAPETSEPYLLNAGTRYFMTLNFKEATGGDYGQVAWRREGDTTAAASLTPLGGSLVGWFADPTGAAIFFTSLPADAQTTENKTATFTIAATGTPGPVWYQWQRAEPGSDTFANIAGARGASYTTPAMKRATDNGAKYRAMVYTPGMSAPSAAATLTVEIDSAGPSVVRAISKENNKGVLLKFSEAIAAPSAGNPAAYTIAGLSVTGATYIAPDMVSLTTSAMTEGTAYTVVIGNTVTDVAVPPNPVVAPGNTATFTGQIKVVGAARFSTFTGIGGALVADLTGSAKYPYSPDNVTLCNGFESPSTIHTDDNYGARLSGFFVPAASGDYVFYISTDDAGAFYVSTDDNPDNKVLRATEPQFGGARLWTGDAEGRRPGCTGGACENISAPIALVGGQAYYIELLYQEGTGNDTGAVRVQLATDEPPADFASPIIGSVLYATIDPADLDKFSLPLSLRSPLGSGTADGFNVRTVQAEQVGTTAIADQYQNFEQVLVGALGPNTANLAGSVNGVFAIPGVINLNSDTAAEVGYFTSAQTGLYLSADLTVPGIPGVGTYGGAEVDLRRRGSFAQEIITYVEFLTPGVHFFGANGQNGFRVSAGEDRPADNGALVVHNGASAGTYYALNSGFDVGGISKPMTQRVEGKLVLADPVPACSTLANPAAIRGNIAVVERGVCTFGTKLAAGLDAGAIAVIVINSRDPGNAEGVWPVIMGVQPTYVDIPGIMIGKPDGDRIKAALLAGEEVQASIAPLLDKGLGMYNRGRSTFETRFAINVKEAGLYPLRMMWYFSRANGNDGDYEWFTHNTEDDFILLNDRSKTGALRTFRTRDFSPITPTIGITRAEGTITINYVGVLQSSDTVDGTYTDVSGATNPFTVSAPAAAKFYRTRQ